MNLADVMDELAGALGDIDGLRVYPSPPDTLAVPAAVVGYPETYVFDATFGRGVDHLQVPVFVLAGRIAERAARDQLGVYCDGSGGKSVKDVLEAATYTAMASVRVAAVVFDAITVNSVEYLAATFTVDIYGSGS